MTGGHRHRRSGTDLPFSLAGEGLRPEGETLALRPTVYFGKYFHTAFEFSYQVRRPLSVDQDRGRVLLPMVFRGSVMPIVAPLGRGTYSRPILYGIYTLSLLNDDAQYYQWQPQDFRAEQTTVHYLGLGVEWWFNSSYR